MSCGSCVLTEERCSCACSPAMHPAAPPLSIVCSAPHAPPPQVCRRGDGQGGAAALGPPDVAGACRHRRLHGLEPAAAVAHQAQVGGQMVAPDLWPEQGAAGSSVCAWIKPAPLCLILAAARLPRQGWPAGPPHLAAAWLEPNITLGSPTRHPPPPSSAAAQDGLLPAPPQRCAGGDAHRAHHAA